MPSRDPSPQVMRGSARRDDDGDQGQRDQEQHGDADPGGVIDAAVTDELIVVGGLDLDARREFISDAGQ